MFHSLRALEEKAQSSTVQSLVPRAWKVFVAAEQSVHKKVKGAMSMNALVGGEEDLVLTDFLFDFCYLSYFIPLL